MKRGVVIGSLAIFLLGMLVYGLFVLPAHLAKSGLDKLAASLPAGTSFTYQDVGYGLFDKTFTLKQAAVHIDQPAVTVEIGDVIVTGGNVDLQRAIDKAAVAPSTTDLSETKLAEKIVFRNIHTAYGIADVTMAQASFDNVRVSLAELVAPLPALQPGASSNLPQGFSGALPEVFQKAGRSVIGTAYDHAGFDKISATVKDPGDGFGVRLDIGQMAINGVDHGNIRDRALSGLTIAAGAFSVTVESIKASEIDHRDFWTAVRNGVPLDQAARKLQGAGETISGVVVRNGTDQVASIGNVTFGNLAYQNGLATSLDMSVRDIEVDPSKIPNANLTLTAAAFGYNKLKMDADLSYAWDMGTGQVHLNKANLTLDQGGSLTLSGTITGVDAAAPLTSGNVRLAGLDVQYDDVSLFDRWLNFVGTRSGRDANAIRAGYIAALEQRKIDFADTPVMLAAIDSVEKFVANPKQIIVKLAPPVPVGPGDLDQTQPKVAIDKLGLTVTAE